MGKYPLDQRDQVMRKTAVLKMKKYNMHEFKRQTINRILMERGQTPDSDLPPNETSIRQGFQDYIESICSRKKAVSHN
jgi:hypothetical protein